MKKILITRIAEEADDYSRELERSGFTVLNAPMLEIQSVDFQRPDLPDYDGLIFTSAQGVRFFDSPSNPDMLVFCVGDRTADALKEKGFENVQSAEGTAVDILPLINVHGSEDGRYLHICGRDIAKDLGFERLIVYKAEPCEEIDAHVLDALTRQDIDAVLFFSKRTAENFQYLADKKGFSKGLKNVSALCISENVAGCVQAENWADVRFSKKPDRAGMLELLRDLEHIDMSTSTDKSIENASEVIERFGGIRPMAKKMEVAVTTVQGWKKRDVIPAARRAKVMEAAAAHDVDLSGILEGVSVANQNDDVAPEVSESEKEKETAPAASVPPVRSSKVSDEPLEAQLAATEKRAVTKSTWIAIALVVLGLAAVVLLFWPSEKQDKRLEDLETDVSEIQDDMDAVKSRQSFFGTLIPEDLSAQLAGLQEQAGKAQEQIGQVLSKAQDISDDVLAEDAGTIVDRAVKLEEHVSEIVGSPVLGGFLQNMNGLSGSAEGQDQLEQAMGVLAGLIGQSEQVQQEQGQNIEAGADGEINQAEQQQAIFENMLAVAQGEDEAVGSVFAGVPQEDLKAAALLLGMSQFRSSLNRDNKSFENDLQVLKGLIGEDSPELMASLEKLAPHAENGVLTPGGLTDEFKSMAGDAVVASLSGEDVSLQDQANARLNEVFQVEKDGELVTGTETQEQLAQTESLLESGDLAGAIAAVQGLDGGAANVMAPWLEQAQVTLQAQQLQGLLEQMINFQAYGSVGQGAEGLQEVMQEISPSRLVTDEEAGINILIPSKKGPLIDMPDMPSANTLDNR